MYSRFGAITYANWSISAKTPILFTNNGELVKLQPYHVNEKISSNFYNFSPACSWQHSASNRNRANYASVHYRRQNVIQQMTLSFLTGCLGLQCCRRPSNGHAQCGASHFSGHGGAIQSSLRDLYGSLWQSRSPTGCSSLIIYLRVTPHIHRSILISLISIRFFVLTIHVECLIVALTWQFIT